MEPSDKDRLREKLARSIGKEPSYEEKKRRKERSKAKRAERPRRAEDDWEADDELALVRRAPARARERPDTNARPAASESGLVVALARTRVEVRTGERKLELPRPHGLELAIGDRVLLDGGRIVSREARRARLARPDPADPRRELVLAANVDLGAIVVSVVAPPLVAGLVDRLQIALASSGVPALVIVNKVELLQGSEAAGRELAELETEWRELGFESLRVSAATGLGLDTLRARLAGRTAVLVGHSGVGKSSLVNALAPRSELATGGLSSGNLRGRHTTSAGRMIELADGAWLVDTPGVREFGLAGLSRDELRGAFAEFARFTAGCRFADCSHLVEPDCAVRAAVERRELSRRRFESYARIAATLDG
ncbi:MAG: ribosome small subunit-dependent GTPase A [Planctomycetes bacterium]|nr:ribosome small subunit-dependent GTPase A [Planctomycetota bacterium]